MFRRSLFMLSSAGPEPIAELWQGTRTILPRKKQVPLPTYSPRDVVTKCLDALQVNDDPQLDHGCCVLLEFRSPAGALATAGSDPIAFRQILSQTNRGCLIDHSYSTYIGSMEGEDSAGMTAQQRVEVRHEGELSAEGPTTQQFEFQLSKWGDLWLIDDILPL
jgi:hypothetical protein